MKPATGCFKGREVHKPIDTAAINAVTYQGQLQVNCRGSSWDFDTGDVPIIRLNINPMANPRSAIPKPIPNT